METKIGLANTICWHIEKSKNDGSNKDKRCEIMIQILCEKKKRPGEPNTLVDLPVHSSSHKYNKFKTQFGSVCVCVCYSTNAKNELTMSMERIFNSISFHSRDRMQLGNFKGRGGGGWWGTKNGRGR